MPELNPAFQCHLWTRNTFPKAAARCQGILAQKQRCVCRSCPHSPGIPHCRHCPLLLSPSQCPRGEDKLGQAPGCLQRGDSAAFRALCRAGLSWGLFISCFGGLFLSNKLTMGERRGGFQENRAPCGHGGLWGGSPF